MIAARLLIPSDMNILGNVFGGAIRRCVDETVRIVAWRHAGRNCMTRRPRLAEATVMPED